MTEVLLGIDAGTSHIKAVAFDTHGVPLASSAVETQTIAPANGWVEQDPIETWERTARTIREVTDTIESNPAAVGITGQGGGCWLVDKDGEPVRNAILWSDGRAADIIEEWKESGVYDKLFQRCGYGVFAGLMVPILRWIQLNEPESLDTVDTTFYCKDWLRSQLTGDVSSDYSDMSLTGFALPDTEIEPALSRLSQVSKLHDLAPPIHRSTDVVGTVSSQGAESTGIPEGTPVITGAIDVASTAYGSGAVRPTDGSIIAGTTLQTQVLMDTPDVTGPPVGYTLNLGSPDFALRAMGAMAGTPNFDWMRQNIATTDDFDAIEEQARNAPRGAEGVLFHPYLSKAGEKAPFVEPGANAQFTGISSTTTRSYLIRAVYEGVALAARDCYEHLPIKPDVTYLAGGGARSELLCQLIADVLDTQVRIPMGEELGAKGAAMQAGVGSNQFSDLKIAAQSMTSVQDDYQPQNSARETYDRLYERYSDTYESMRNVWTRYTE